MAGFCKALEVGGGTDTALLTGADAVRRESVATPTLQVMQGQAALRLLRSFGELRKGGTVSCEHVDYSPTMAKLIDHFHQCEGMDTADADGTARWLLTRIGSRVAQERQTAATAA
jgi:hypothetical protein